MKKKNTGRIQFLDGLRGIAILNVVMFHAYFWYKDIEPFKHYVFFSELFQFSSLGVQLFFAISGYVIYMTLFRYKNFKQFILARYFRLAPAMLIASIIIYLTSFYVIERPRGPVTNLDFLPSLTFIQPGIINKLTGLDIRVLDGSFWSIFVEVKFYLIAGTFFYFLKDKKLIGLTIIYAIYIFCSLLINYYKININFLTLLYNIQYNLGAKEFGWFLLGISAFKYSIQQQQKNLLILIFYSLILILLNFSENLLKNLAYIITISFFILPFFSEKIKNFLSNPFLLFIGFVSYPLYLLHQNLVTGMAIKLSTKFPNLNPLLYPAIFIIMIIFISFLIAKSEPKIKKYCWSFFKIENKI